MSPFAASTAPRALIAAGAAVLAATVSLSSQSPPQSAPPPPPPPSSSEVRIHLVGNPRAPRRLADLKLEGPAANPITVEKADLGRRLFFDPRLSNDRSVSCATCHDPERAFADTRPLATGVFGRVGKRHSPSLVNRGFGRHHFWDGRARTLEDQVLQPITDPNEMDLTIEEAVKRLTADDSYRTEFTKVFARPPSSEDLAYALATFIRTIRSGDAPYDRFVAGDTTALSAEQQRGLRIFRTKGLCVICHEEPLFTQDEFHNTGVAWQPAADGTPGRFQDDGRFAVSRIERDRGRFKTPTLREVARTAPYMHDGSLATLEDVIDFYNSGGRRNANLFPAIQPLGLTAEDKQALVKFLESLSGVVTGK